MSSEADTRDTSKIAGRPEILRLSSLTLLVVDDSEFTLRLITSILKGLEVGRIMTATGGNDAIDLIRFSMSLIDNGENAEIDIVLCDWHMKRGNGTDVLKWLRLHDRDKCRFMPFIMMSGYAESKHVKRARDLGADEFMAKPFSVKSLGQRLLAVIDNPRPFVKTPHYFGPDRRRKAASDYLGEERRGGFSSKVEVIHERD